MSPGLAARCAAADEEFRRAGEREARQRQVRAEQAHERAVLAAAQQKAAAEGIPLNLAMRTVGHTVREFVELRSAVADVEDARVEAEQARLMRRLAADAGLLDLSEAEPSGVAFEVAAARIEMAPAGESFDPDAIAKGVRSRWLRRQYRPMA